MSGKLQHLWSFQPWRLASWPSSSDPFVPALLSHFLWTLSPWSTTGNFDCFSDQNSHPRRGQTTRSVYRKLWSSLSSASSVILTSRLRMSIFCSSLWLPTSTFLTFTLGASSSKPCIHSSKLYAVAGAQAAFIIPWGNPGPLALVLFPQQQPQ